MEFEEIQTGTTIMAFKYKDGIIMAADSRTSAGAVVSSRITDKITEITPFVYCCRSGSAADTQRIAREVAREVKLMSIKEGKRPSVEKTARMIKKLIYENQKVLTAGIIVAGYDESPRIFNIKVCGTIIEGNVALGGSGSAYVYGFVDEAYKPDMSLEAGLDFARKTVKMAIRRDNVSGGIIRMTVITDNEVQRYVTTEQYKLTSD